MLSLLLFLCHTLFQLGIILLLNFNFLFNLDLVFSCFLGILSRQPSILVLLPCVDDFHSVSLFLVIGLTSFFETLFSSHVSACSWHCSSRLLLAVLFCLRLAMLFYHFVPLSEILVDLLLFVVQVLRLCAPFRQSGFASFVDFFPITGSSCCDAVSVLCLLASPPPPLPCGSLLLRGSPQAPPTPLLSLRHFVIIGSR